MSFMNDPLSFRMDFTFKQRPVTPFPCRGIEYLNGVVVISSDDDNVEVVTPLILKDPCTLVIFTFLYHRRTFNPFRFPWVFRVDCQLIEEKVKIMSAR
jgi:hypothetical protein